MTLGANGTATYKANFASAGVHTIVAQYAGDTTHGASTGSVFVTVGGTTSGKGSFTIALSPSSLTVKRGSQQSETITVTPKSGYTGTVNLGYATSNDTALTNLCVFVGTGLNSDGSATVSGASPVTGQITIDTNAADCTSSTTGGAVNGRGLRLVPRTKGMAANAIKNIPTKRNPLTGRDSTCRAAAGGISWAIVAKTSRRGMCDRSGITGAGAFGLRWHKRTDGARSGKGNVHHYVHGDGLDEQRAYFTVFVHAGDQLSRTFL